MNKSPFFIVPEFLSPLECEDIVNRSYFEFPNTVNGVPVKSTTQNLLTQNRILPYLEDIIPSAYLLITEAIEKTGRQIDFEHFYWCDVYTCERYCEPMRRGEKVILDYILPVK